MCVHEQFCRLDAWQDLCQRRNSRNRETSDQKSLSCSDTGTTCSQVLLPENSQMCCLSQSFVFEYFHRLENVFG